jgi:hypothetical protein
VRLAIDCLEASNHTVNVSFSDIDVMRLVAGALHDTPSDVRLKTTTFRDGSAININVT